jgi:NAD(P)-dependent dehydrogenase (short-subunit alcohol dehydrogenase family)
VTGSGSGLGRAYATLLAEWGTSVVVMALGGTGFDPGMADAVVQETAAASVKAVSCYEDIESREGCLRVIDTALSQFGRLYKLIQNAGWITFTPLEK